MMKWLKALLGSFGGRVAMAMVAMLVLNVCALAAQGETSGTEVVTAPALSSISAIIAASIFGTYLVKRVLVNVPVAQSLPLWIYVVLISVVLTFFANRVLHTLDGELGYLIWQAVYNAAAASGLREWVYSGLGKPMERSAATT